ncbi:MAG: 16S rRNA (cytidine(1402)-2'-O)-methyltransferase [Anaerolineaceae bacterium]|nr:16S rRNA (cytidine(1402)-2'-O)-methyltransferase [Anaerolineaceae bacterium]
MNFKPGKLYLVSIPIGNPKDITLRALDILSSVDFIICEDIRNASRLLKKCSLDEKPFMVLNEHNEKKDADLVVNDLLIGKNAALISDCGTPVFADPGHHLIRYAVQSSIPIVPIPGVSSLMAALSLVDRQLHQFYFAGFLPRDKQERLLALKKLKAQQVAIVIMDTPYRMQAVLQDIAKVFSPNQEILLATDLTQKTEQIYRGHVREVQTNIQKQKAEFILVIYNTGR